MNKFRYSKYTKIFLLICILLALVSCFGTKVEYVVYYQVVTATPDGEIPGGTNINPTPTPFYESVKQLDVEWSFDSIKCTAAGKLKEATVRLIVSGGQPPYKISPSSPFSISDGNTVKITVESQGTKPFEAYVPPPSCKKDSVKDPGEGNQPGGGSTPPPGGQTPVPTLNPTWHP